jgi:hypothetical protein
VWRAGSCVIVVLAFAGAAAAQPLPVPAPGDRVPPRVALLPTHTSGIDPVVGRFVDRALQRAASALGCAVLDDEQVAVALPPAAAAPLGLAELWRVTHRARAELGVSAIATAQRGKYALHLRVASSDGRGPFHAQGEASEIELEAAVERLLAQAFALARAAPTAAATPPGQASPPRAVATAASPSASPAPPSQVPPSPVPTAASSRSDRSPARAWLRLALHNDLAFGLAEDSFLNDVVGARADLRLDAGLWLGLHAGYANLQGRARRVHGFLPYAQIEQRIALAPGRALAIPLRLGLGYLLRNGGFLRLSSGVAIPLGARTELALDLVAPAFWITRDRTLFSLDLGLELNVELEP